MVCAKIPEILAAMTKSCMSPTEIAKASGVSVNIVYRIRTGDQERKQVSGLGDIRRCSEDWQTNQKIRAFVFS